MWTISLRHFLLPYLLISSLACSPETPQFPDPDKLPYKLEPVAELGGNVYGVDLDGDGRDEIVQEDHFRNPSGGGYILLRTQDGNTIEQVNFAGWVRSIHFLDFDRDGTKEILVPFIRNDSLFVSFIDSRGRKLFHFFLIQGEPRQEDSGALAWDGGVKGFHVADVNRDDQDELVTIVFTGFSRLPRGILINSLPDGRLLGKMIVGSPLGDSFVGDFNHDGYLEIVAQTSAPSNGAVAGGFDDRHSSLIVFALSSAVEATWSREMGGQWTSPQLFYEDFNGDGQREFLAFTWTHSSRPERANLEYIEPGAWRTYGHRPLNIPLQSPQVSDLDRDAKPEIIAIHPQGEVWVFDENFNEMQRRQVAAQLSGLILVPDVDDDGVEEIVASNSEGAFLLDPNLRVKAVLPGGSIAGVVRRGIGMAPYLLVHCDDKAMAMRLVENRLYVFNRYGAIGLGVLGSLVVVGLGAMLYHVRHRQRLLQSVQTLALDTDNRGLFLLDPDRRIEMANATLHHLLGIPTNRRLLKKRIDDVIDLPDLIAFLRQAIELPPHRRELTLSLDRHGHKRMLRIVADPVPLARNEPPHWLVCLADCTTEMEMQRAMTWAQMAQRVAHDVKNPLTSILLTLQRLQMEYRERAPEMAVAFDTYTTRIIERIESLRRMAQNFMKFVNVEKLSLIEGDLNALVKEASGAIGKGLPPDIDLELKLCPELPRVRFDPEPMQSVLENLVSNAINAMPEGGKITISTQLAQGLQFFPATGEPRDYVEIEVQDTGVGIEASDRERLFEPNFTASPNGTGLGLAMVKKIIDDHGGHIEVNSEPGAGSAFCVYLPVGA